MDVKCGTFLDWTFSGLLRNIRIRNELTMRDMCKRCGMDIGNYSRLEANKYPPPKNKKSILKIIKGLYVSEHEKQMLLAASFTFHLGALMSRYD